MRLHPGAVLAANSIANALLALNSAANFAIYCLVGKKFRRILRRRVLRYCCAFTTATGDDIYAHLLSFPSFGQLSLPAFRLRLNSYHTEPSTQVLSALALCHFNILVTEYLPWRPATK